MKNELILQWESGFVKVEEYRGADGNRLGLEGGGQVAEAGAADPAAGGGAVHQRNTMRISQNKEIPFQNERDFFIDARSSQLRRSQKQCARIRIHLAPQRRFERPTLRLGEPLNICHLCSPMYRKVAIRQAFFVFRVAPCSSKFTGVVRCSPVHFSSFLDFSKKGN